MFNDAAQNLFNADYLGFDSKLDVTGEPNLKNVVYSTFKTDDADVNYGFVYDSTNDYYYTPDLSAVNEYVIVEATSLSAPIVNVNDCYSTQLSSGKWLIYCSSGTDAVHRAQILKTLFYNREITKFDTITSIRTSHANDVDKRAHLISRPHTGGQPITRTIDGTFSDTTNNTDCSSWSDLLGGSDGADTKNWQIPTGTTRNSSTSSSPSLELGTDTSADENDNPSDCRIACTGNFPNAAHYLHVVVLCVGDITWSGTVDETIIDYFTDESIPLFTIADTLSNEGVYTSTLIFKDTTESVTNCIPVINSTIDASSSEQISVSADGGSNWTDVNNAEIARPTAGTDLWRRIVITRTDLSVEDKVTEQAVKYNLY